MLESTATPASMDSPSGENIGFVIFISIVATIGGFLFGFDSGVINGTVDGLQQAFNSASAGTGFNVSSMLLGCAVGAFFAGRKQTADNGNLLNTGEHSAVTGRGDF